MTRRFALLLPLVLVACAGRRHPSLAEPSGPLRPLNPGRWTPTAADLRGPRPSQPSGRQAGAGG